MHVKALQGVSGIAFADTLQTSTTASVQIVIGYSYIMKSTSTQVSEDTIWDLDRETGQGIQIRMIKVSSTRQAR